MKKISLNNNWICKRAGQPEQGMTVNIPHDAMQMDEKDELSAGGVHNGWYVCHDYIYEKAFCASEDWREKRVILEFEGIYKNAIVFLNGERIAVHEYGYTGFYIDISERLCYEKDNSIKVYVSNSEQPNCRTEKVSFGNISTAGETLDAGTAAAVSVQSNFWRRPERGTIRNP